MSYELTTLLMKCKVDDFEFINERIDSYINFTSDSELKKKLGDFKKSAGATERQALAELVEREIRYLGSSDIAYASRHLLGQKPAGVSVHEMVEDVASVLKVKVRKLGSVESKLERLVLAVAEKTFFSLSEADQREMLKRGGAGDDHIDAFLQKLKRNKAAFLPALLTLLGPEITVGLLQGIVIASLSAFLGKEAAKKLLAQLLVKFPWWAEWLGPIVWALSLAWLALDVQGVAYRKTIPILLYLGVVALRDGLDDLDGLENS